MSDAVEKLDGKIRLSIARLAEEFGMARETVSKRLGEYAVLPDGRRNGYPVYRLSSAVEAILGNAITDEKGNRDPHLLAPDKRNQWFQSELRRMEVEMQSGQLIPAAEHESDVAQLIKSLVQFLETLPDQLERDCALSPEQVEALHLAVDRQRQSYYDQFVASETHITQTNEGEI